MGLFDKIKDDIKTAMKEKKPERVETLRFLQSAIKNREIELRPNPIKEEDILNVIKKSVKQRKESIEQYLKGGRADLVEKEKMEMAILEEYLPQALSKDQLTELVDRVIKSTGANSIKQMGQVMKEVSALAQGAADNKTLSEIIKARLGS